MFVWSQNSDSRQPKIVSNIKAKASTTFTHGQALIVSSGRWETAAAGAKVGGIYNGPTFTSGADDFIEVIEARPGDEFIANYTGTPAGTFLVGLETADIIAGGVNLDAATVVAGAFSILAVDTANKKAVVRVKKRQFS